MGCSKADLPNDPGPGSTHRITKTISYDGVSVDLVIDHPGREEADVLMVFHGTVRNDGLILQAAHNVLERFKGILLSGSTKRYRQATGRAG